CRALIRPPPTSPLFPYTTLFRSVGDTSDNIPGVAGIGPKTAVRLLEQYDTLEVVYEHLDEQTKGLRARLEEGREYAFLSQKLARDRKSTRLNSSHVKISYAVFCL